MATCLIALGGNLGDRAANLNAALKKIAASRGIANVVTSKFLETKPVGGPAGQPGFLNAAAKLECRLSPLELARRLHEIETQLGRARAVRWDARTVDLDLLLYDDVVCRTAELQLPHPRMTVRQFVMRPVEEIAADMHHPGTGWTMAEHSRHLRETSRHIALVGGSEELRQKVSAEIVRLAQADGEAVWDISTNWSIRAFLDQDASKRMMPRTIVILQAAELPGSEADSSANEVKLANVHASRDLARLTGGAILRLEGKHDTEDIAKQVFAAMQASE